MAWDVRDDHDQYGVAHQLQQRHRSRWLVMWGPGSRAYFAFYRGHAHVFPLSAPTGQQLHHQILHTEADLATPAPTRWSCPDPRCSWTSTQPAFHHCPQHPT